MNYQIETDIDLSNIPVGYVPIAFDSPTGSDRYVVNGKIKGTGEPRDEPAIIVIPTSELNYTYSFVKEKVKEKEEYYKIDADFEPSQKEIYNDDGL